MSDATMMAVQVQRPGRPETRSTILVAMHFNLAHLKDQGWEFPPFDGIETFFGGVYERQTASEAA